MSSQFDMSNEDRCMIISCPHCLNRSHYKTSEECLKFQLDLKERLYRIEPTTTTDLHVKRKNNEGVRNTSSAPEDHGDSMKILSKSSSISGYSRTVRPYRAQIVWRNVIWFAYLHIAALYGAVLMITSAKVLTSIFAILLYQLSTLAITAGAHRLWTHRCYKARWPLRIFLMLIDTLAFQNHIYDWARDHRLHHKHSDTNADPHNPRRGFFFSHVGWLLYRKHPDVKEKGKTIDLSDLTADSVVMFQKKYYFVMMPLLCFTIPTIIPMYFWGESLKNAWFVATMFRYALSLNVTWLVNSVAHRWGNKPYDKNIRPAENVWTNILALGEGWHNYHHVFPWDYKAAELGNYRMNLTTAFIDLCAFIGLAYDLKTVPSDIVQKRMVRTGDGSGVSP